MISSPTPVLEARGLTKRYRTPRGEQLTVLTNLDLTLEGGDMLAVVGHSGCGKSTLLHLLGLLDPPDEGDLLLAGRPVAGMDEATRARVRNERIGFIFQFHHLLKEFTALENVMMPRIIAGRPHAEARQRAGVLLERVGLSDRLEHRPGELSGGEQQRVAIARALANDPQILLADEPTGNLDEATAETIHALLIELNREEGVTTVIVTHNRSFARRLPRRMEIHRGRLASWESEDASAT